MRRQPGAGFGAQTPKGTEGIAPGAIDDAYSARSLLDAHAEPTQLV
ncbi:MAG: hypothetical protein V4550_12185 [Gemmatimonadota bacterium]